MTTSADKAEILSSSLEAFKKIQQERDSLCAANDAKLLGPQYLNLRSGDKLNKSSAINDEKGNAKDSIKKLRKQSGGSDLAEADLNGGKWSTESSSKPNLVQTERAPQNSSTSVVNASRLPPRDNSAAGKTKSKQSGSEAESYFHPLRGLSMREKVILQPHQSISRPQQNGAITSIRGL
ncbi:hypothetical protein Pyn_31157 [Prunus yedoensis var. nudiflora]|uniref:Uncharacterized protein n=1 Tax=Prunus yedoensis var. nudiflora TaxID=2094558 RepID=A0A314XHD5_PRUYE|nr:hypothetical protein Pyn_31157 [Prunus yedoensis var. nudiflora]